MATDWFRCLEDFMEIYNTMEKFPSRAFGSIKISREIEKLKEQLNIAIKNEEYEKAAILRDQIRNLESEPKQYVSATFWFCRSRRCM